MASDITLAVGDGTRRMTYAELAAVRNISVPAARRLPYVIMAQADRQRRACHSVSPSVGAPKTKEIRRFF